MEPVGITAKLLEAEIKNEIMKESIKKTIETEAKKFHPLLSVREQMEHNMLRSAINPDQEPLTDYMYEKYKELKDMQYERRLNQALNKRGFDSMQELESTKFYNEDNSSKIVPPQFERAFERIFNKVRRPQPGEGIPKIPRFPHEIPFEGSYVPNRIPRELIQPSFIMDGPRQVIEYYNEKRKAINAEKAAAKYTSKILPFEQLKDLGTIKYD